MAVHVRPCHHACRQQQPAGTAASVRRLAVCHAKKRGSAAANSDTGGPSQHAAQHKAAHATNKTRQHEAPVQPHTADHIAVEQLQQDPLHAAFRLYELLERQLAIASGQPPALTDDDVLLNVLGFAAEAVQASTFVVQDLSSDTLIQLVHDARRVCDIQAIQQTSQLQLARSRVISLVEALLPDTQPVLSEASCSQMIGMIDDMQHLQVSLPEDWCWAELLCDAASRTEDRFLATCSVPQLMVFTQQLTALEPDLLEVVASEQLQERITAAVDRLVQTQHGILVHLQQPTATASETDSSTLPSLLTDLPWSAAVLQGSVLSAHEMTQLVHMCLNMTTQDSPPKQQQWVVQLSYCALNVKTPHQDAGALVTLCTTLLQHNLALLNQPDVQQAFICSICDALMQCDGSGQTAAEAKQSIAGAHFYPAFAHPDFPPLLQQLMNRNSQSLGAMLPVSLYGALVSHVKHVDIHDDHHHKNAAAFRHHTMSAVIAACSAGRTVEMQAVAAALYAHWLQHASMLLADAHVDELLQLPQLAEAAGHSIAADGLQDRWEQQLVNHTVSMENATAQQYHQQLLQQVLLPMWHTEQQLPHSLQLIGLCLADATDVAQQLTVHQLLSLAVGLTQHSRFNRSSAQHHMLQALKAAAWKCTAEELPELMRTASMLHTSGAHQQPGGQDWAHLLSQLLPKHVSSWSSHQRCVVLHSALVQLQAELPALSVHQLIQPLLLARLQNCSLADVLLLLEAVSTIVYWRTMDHDCTVQLLQYSAELLSQPTATFLQQYRALHLLAQLAATSADASETAYHTDMQAAVCSSAGALLAGLLATFPATPDITASQQLVSVPGMLLGMGISLNMDWCKAGYTPSWHWLNSWAHALGPHTQQLKPHTATSLLGILHQRLLASRDQLKFYTTWYASSDIPVAATGVTQLLHSISLTPFGNGSTVPMSLLCHALAAAASRQVAGADKLCAVLEGCTSGAQKERQLSKQWGPKEAAWVRCCCITLREHLQQASADTPAAAADGSVTANDIARVIAALLVLRPADGSDQVVDDTVMLYFNHLAGPQDPPAANLKCNSGIKVSACMLEVLLQACMAHKFNVPAQLWDVYQSRSKHESGLQWGRSLLLVQQAGRPVTADDLRQVAHAMTAEKQHENELECGLSVLAQLQRFLWSQVCTMGLSFCHTMTTHNPTSADSLWVLNNLFDSALHPEVAQQLQAWQAASRQAAAAATAVEEYLTSHIKGPGTFAACPAAAPAYVSAKVANIKLQNAARLAAELPQHAARITAWSTLDLAILLHQQEGHTKLLYSAVACIFEHLKQGQIAMAADDAQAAVMWCDVLWVAAIINTHIGSGNSTVAPLKWPLQQPLDMNILHPRLLKAATCGQPAIAIDLLGEVEMVINWFKGRGSPDVTPHSNTLVFDLVNWSQHLVKLAVFASSANRAIPLQVMVYVRPLVVRQLANLADIASSRAFHDVELQQLLIDAVTITCGQPLPAEGYAELQDSFSEKQVVRLLTNLDAHLERARHKERFALPAASMHNTTRPVGHVAMQRVLGVLDAVSALAVRNYIQPERQYLLPQLSHVLKQQISTVLEHLQSLDADGIVDCSCNPYLRYCTLHLVHVYATSTCPAYDALAASFHAAVGKELQTRRACSSTMHDMFVRNMGLTATSRGDLIFQLRGDDMGKKAKGHFAQCMDLMMKSDSPRTWEVMDLLYSQYVRLPVDRPMGVALQGNMHIGVPEVAKSYVDVASLPSSGSASFFRGVMNTHLVSLDASRQGITWLVTAPAVERFVRYSLANMGSWVLLDPAGNNLARTTGTCVSNSFKEGGRFIGSKFGRVWRLSLLYGMAVHTPGVDKELVQDCKQRLVAAANAACKDHTPPIEAVLTWTAPWLVPGLNDKPVTLQQDMPIEAWLSSADWSGLVGPKPDPIQMLQLQTLCFTCPDFYQLIKSVQHSKGLVPVPGTHRYKWVYAQTMEALGILLDFMQQIKLQAAGKSGSWTVAEQLAVALRMQYETLQQRKTLLECDAGYLSQLCSKVRVLARGSPFSLSQDDDRTVWAMQRALESTMEITTPAHSSAGDDQATWSGEQPPVTSLALRMSQGAALLTRWLAEKLG